MIRRWLNNSRFGHLLGLHSPSAAYLGRCWCQVHEKRELSELLPYPAHVAWWRVTQPFRHRCRYIAGACVRRGWHGGRK